ncbi:HEAT repeat domain-containing protein [Chitinophaga sp. SYP-B3965]|uniref:HEAT repeat domain-containing protein n=1 Tax=Chitinophaga sp. SYP-B3965 TaxID=2663120 RepID=UPI001299A6A1|nr:HEAT repeat domain-containing protein [Chitinophaga sp. SYP-B3965]MRG43681.1 HEAT repeat domain-containing protein [Chitinophaga sp. SYP-B3965]
MAFYDLPKEERATLVRQMEAIIEKAVLTSQLQPLLIYAADEDTYIRKSAYQALGKIYPAHPAAVLQGITTLMQNGEAKVRQTAVNAAGEIGRHDFSVIRAYMDQGLTDAHYSVRNAVIGSVKKMGEKNPVPVLDWAKGYLEHPDKEIRREICHGIELRGRTHPQDILPLLKTLQFDKTARVRNTLVHVLGQIAYKKGCLETVVADLKTWQNQELVRAALDEIADVHERYKDFAIKTQAEAIAYMAKHFEDI